jgi:hypothetical protein
MRDYITLEQYIESLQKIIKEYPETAKMPLIYDNGDDYHVINYLPSLFNVECLDEYCLSATQYEECTNDGIEFNAVCVN